MATRFPLIEGRSGGVAAGKAASAEIGLEILKGGGNAVDAGVAMVLSLGVTDGANACFGGEMPALIYLAKEKRVVVIAGQGPAPRAYGKKPMDWKAAVPGQFDACLLAVQQYGNLRAADVIEPTIRLTPRYRRDHRNTPGSKLCPQPRAVNPGDRAAIIIAHDTHSSVRDRANGTLALTGDDLTGRGGRRHGIDALRAQ